jgi:hypothetical protein
MDTILASAVVAAFVAAATTIFAGILQRRHDVRHRFDDLRRERYAMFLREVDQFRRLVQNQRGVVDDPAWRPGIPVPFDVPLTDDIGHLAAEIGLLAPMGSEIGKAAKAAYETLIDLGAYAYDSTKPPTFIHNAPSLEGYPQAREAAQAARDLFVRLAGAGLRG